MWNRIIKLREKSAHALNLASVQISIFKHRTGVSVIYHNQMDIMAQASANILMKILIWWNILASPGQSLCGYHSKSLSVTEFRQAN